MHDMYVLLIVQGERWCGPRGMRDGTYRDALRPPSIGAERTFEGQVRTKAYSN